MHPDPRATAEGDVILASKYRARERIGEGGMGIVYAGDHLELKTRVAIKVLQPKLAKDEVARTRFVREARLAASIEDEHSTRIYDVGTDDLERPFMVMEFLAGEPLDVRLAREQRLPLERAATIVMQVLSVLAEAHSKNLVHRDLKPSNLFLLTKPGEPIWVKVMDFGISKSVAPPSDLAASDASASRGSAKLTEPRTILGSPEYMSPEQLRDATSVDGRADIWACGVLLFELLTGSTPFASPTLPDLYAKIVGQEPMSLSDAGLDAASMPPQAIVTLIERCLRKDPRERPQTAYEVARVLAPHAAASARTLLPRIRAWCAKSHATPALGETDAQDLPIFPWPHASTRQARVVGGVSMMLVSGVLAFAAASYRPDAPEVLTSAASDRSRVRATHEAPLSSEATPLEPAPPASSLGVLASPPSTTTGATTTANAKRSPPPTAPSFTASSVAPRPPASSLPMSAPTPPAQRQGETSKKSDGGRIQDLDGIDLIR